MWSSSCPDRRPQSMPEVAAPVQAFRRPEGNDRSAAVQESREEVQRMTTVLYADDEESSRASFVSHHANSGWFVSAYEGSLDNLPTDLESRAQLPDLLVLDLYVTKAPP